MPMLDTNLFPAHSAFIRTGYTPIGNEARITKSGFMIP